MARGFFVGTMKRLLVGGTLALCFLSAAVLQAAAAEITPQERKLIPLAKKEGAVILLNTSITEFTANELGKAFVRHYGLGSDFKFHNLKKGTGAALSQVRQEFQANKSTADVLQVSAPDFFDGAAKRGFFLPLDSGQWKFHAEVKKAGQYSNYPHVIVTNAYAFVPVWNTSCPGMANVNITSYADTVAPSLKGKTISTDITKSTTFTNTAVALDESGFDLYGYWDKLKATDPIVEFRTEPKMQMVVSCERPIDAWNLPIRVRQYTLKKPELRKFIKVGSYKEGHLMLGNQAAVLKGAPNPNAGKLFLEFLLTDEGANLVAKNEALYSFRQGWKVPPEAKEFMKELSEMKLIGLKDWVKAGEKFEAVRAEWIKRFK